MDRETQTYIENFYKKAVNGKKGNLFTRVDALEELLNHLQVRDVNQYITNLIQENKEIIIPSLLGGVTDPTDETFSGIVISPSGQIIDGIAYSFAIVVDGVVVSGLGNDGDPVVVGGTGDVVGPASAVDSNLAAFDTTTGKLIKDSGISSLTIGTGDVIGDTVPSNTNNIVIYSDETGKHIKDSGLNFDHINLAAGTQLYLDNTASDIEGYKTLLFTMPDDVATENVTSVSSVDGYKAIEEFILPALGYYFTIPYGCNSIQLLAKVSETPVGTVTIRCNFYRREGDGTEHFAGSISKNVVETSPNVIFISEVSVTLTDSVYSPTDRIVLKIDVANSDADSIDVTTYWGSTDYPAIFRTPVIITGAGTGDMLKATYDPTNVEGDAFDSANTEFTPAVAADWSGSTDPGQVNDALDQLAARLTDEENKAETDPVFSASEAASFASGDAAKLAGIEAGAEVNNISDTDATDLTDGGETTLHTHDTSPLTGLADGEYSGDVETGVAGAALVFGNLCYLASADSKWELTDASAEATAGPVKIGICVLNASEDAATAILTRGNVRSSSFPSMDVGAVLFVGTTAGEIQTSAPYSNSGEIIRSIGHTNNGNKEISFHPDSYWFKIG